MTEHTCLIPDPDAQPFLSVAEVAKILGVSRRSALNAIERGDVAAIRFGHLWRVPTRAFLDKYDLLAPVTQSTGPNAA